MIKAMVLAIKKYFHLILVLLIVILMIVLAIWVSNRLIRHLDQKLPDVGMSGYDSVELESYQKHFN